MKRADTKRNFDELVSRLTENEILTNNAMSCVTGGESDGNGSELIIIQPPSKP